MRNVRRSGKNWKMKLMTGFLMTLDFTPFFSALNVQSPWFLECFNLHTRERNGTKLCTASSEAEFPWMFVYFRFFVVLLVPNGLYQKLSRFSRFNLKVAWRFPVAKYGENDVILASSTSWLTSCPTRLYSMEHVFHYLKMHRENSGVLIFLGDSGFTI